MPEPLHFVLPSEHAAISGGNIYNAELVQALREITEVRTLSVVGWKERLHAGDPGVYFVDSLNLAEGLALPASSARQRFVLIVHHLPSLEPDLALGDARLALEAAALPRFDAFLASSPFTADWLVTQGCSAQRVLTVTPGLRPVQGPTRSYEHPLRALLVGNLIPRKAVLDFLRALETRIEASDRFSIDVIGRIDLDPECAQDCARLINGSERLRPFVRLLGPIDHGLMAEHYSAAALLVSAAKMETFGMALQEARAHGLPLLALDRGYARQHLVEGENGHALASIAELSDCFLDVCRNAGRAAQLFERAQAVRASNQQTWGAAARRLLLELERCLP